WGNWQYLAGVGADPRGSRQFNLEKQTQMYDQNHEFIDRWQGRDSRAQQDVVDIVDWPIATQQENGDK
ncbi:FAD-binding domain-containing protein, partial [Vibrio parahaemolyticus]|nr:FAD-binding domain-containing protein [Vibrio parahaemolyticus]MDF4855307.1 FAD-binding domain-containing protein [Vibrio parahaemolyticus]